MLFNSYEFVLFFLPITVAVYFLIGKSKLSHSLQKIWLLSASFYFYAYLTPKYLLVIGISIIVNYLLCKVMVSLQNNLSNRIQSLIDAIIKKHVRLDKVILVFAIAFNLGIIFYFKYYDFFIANLNTAIGASFTFKNLILPLGISFFTFQQVSYVIDTYKGETNYSFLDYALFVAFFPQLVAGPIVLHNEIIPQFENKDNHIHNYANLSHGLYLFAIGFFKKVIIADTLGRAVNFGFANYTVISSLDTIIVILSYTFQIYFDFSGYCDIASGIAKMFNITLPINFNSPYKALNIVDFWQRWHMTLTRFLRIYVYFPLGGSKKGNYRTHINILIVFIVSGIWHGANWTFIIWGFLHGVANVLTRIFKKQWDSMHVVFQWVLTFGFVNVTWLLFRAEFLGKAFVMLKNAVSLSKLRFFDHGIASEFIPIMSSILKKVPIIGQLAGGINEFYMILFLALCFTILLNFENVQTRKFSPDFKNSIITVILLVWSIISLTGVSTFLYFNF